MIEIRRFEEKVEELYLMRRQAVETARSVKKTGCLAIAEEDSKTEDVGAEIAARIEEKAFD